MRKVKMDGKMGEERTVEKMRGRGGVNAAQSRDAADAQSCDAEDSSFRIVMRMVPLLLRGVPKTMPPILQDLMLAI